MRRLTLKQSFYTTTATCKITVAIKSCLLPSQMIRLFTFNARFVLTTATTTTTAFALMVSKLFS